MNNSDFAKLTIMLGVICASWYLVGYLDGKHTVNCEDDYNRGVSEGLTKAVTPSDE